MLGLSVAQSRRVDVGNFILDRNVRNPPPAEARPRMYLCLRERPAVLWRVNPVRREAEIE